MAKKAVTIRVFQLAKELGVTSKDIIGKCDAEDIPNVTNHMSALSLGLAATVREWFGEGGAQSTTAVQTAAPVNVVVARAKAKKKATKKSISKTAGTVAPAAPATEPETPVAPDAPEVDAPPTPAPSPELPEQTPARLTPIEHETPELAPVADRPTDIPPDQSQPPEPEAPIEQEEPLAPAAAAVVVATAEAPGAAQPAKGSPTMNVPDRPNVVARRGRQLEKPTKTEMVGPKVIRVESPEPVRRRPPDRPSDTTIRRSGPRSGRGVGVSYPPAAPGGQEPPRPGRQAPSSRRNKRRTTTTRDEAGRVGRAFQANTETKSFDWSKQDLIERERRLTRSVGFFKAHRRDSQKRSQGSGQRAVTAAEAGGLVKVEEPITIKNLSAACGVKAIDILRKLIQAKIDVNINSAVETETAVEVMLEFGIELEVVEQKSAEEQITEQFEQREIVDERPCSPVVTILGHVDHGKTSLLDRIRNTNVADGEAGGITQATSAFRVPVTVGESEHLITFIDTPGHEAFTEMRARGAQVTNLAVLVVAADDGVMPQTVESINHLKAAEVPIVVALNKIDKPEATDSNIQRIHGELAEHELAPSDWGGTTEVVRISALKGEGIQDLLDVLDYQAQLLELKADFGGRAEGTVLESRMEEGRGPVANVLVQQGLLKKGDFVALGRAYGRVRDIVNDRRERIDEAGPSMPVAISGLNEVPEPGDKFYVVGSSREAEASAAERRDQQRERALSRERIGMDNILERMTAEGRTELPLIIKGDVQGSVDTLQAALQKISTDDITIAIKHAAVGGVNDSDIVLAEATGAIIIGFNVTASSKARKRADERRVDVRLYDVIYDITDDVIKAAEGLLEPEHKLEVIGHSEVRETFKISKVGMIAGCFVTDGVIERNALIRVTRGDIVIEKDRKLDQLKRFKDDAKEVRAGHECGMKIEGYDDIKVGDVLECYKRLEVQRTLSS